MFHASISVDHALVARFDVYRLPRRQLTGSVRSTLVVDVQSAHLDYLETRIVVPLGLRSEVKPVQELHPVLYVEDESYVLITHALGSVLCGNLGRPLANVAAYRDQITRALDLLLTGF